MRIIISGYGRMGKEIEKVAIHKEHDIVGIIDDIAGWALFDQEKIKADVVIDFSEPNAVVDIIDRCFNENLPIVTGTTGWYDQLDTLSENCAKYNGTLFYAPNFSLGVNLFYIVNTFLAKTMSAFDTYKVSMKEIHHIHKLDSPSGTAIKAAEDIISKYKGLDRWINRPEFGAGILPIESERIDEVPGTHIVTYSSESDNIELKHEAKNRSGFALGAVNAAEWVVDKKGIFTMDELIKSLL